MKVWHQAKRYDPSKAAAITWLVSIARNTALDELRRQNNDQLTSTEIDLDSFASHLLTGQAEAERAQMLGRLQGCLSDLERDRQDAVILAYLEGWSRDELSARFSQPVNTIKTWLHRSLKQLKGCLDV